MKKQQYWHFTFGYMVSKKEDMNIPREERKVYIKIFDKVLFGEDQKTIDNTTFTLIRELVKSGFYVYSNPQHYCVRHTNPEMLRNYEYSKLETDKGLLKLKSGVMRRKK